MRKKLKLMEEECTIATEFFGRQVMCKDCKREYTCTPERNYYAATSVTSGICLPCLLRTPLRDPENRSHTGFR